MFTKNYQPLLLILATLYAPFASASVMSPYEIPESLSSNIELPWAIDRIVKSKDLHCFKTTAPTNDELRAEVLKTDETKLKEILEKLLKDKDGKASASTTQDEITIEAAQRIFGEREGLQLLYLFIRYRMNGSHFQTAETSPWNAAELDTIILALSDLPDHLIPFPLNRYIKHKGYQAVFRHTRGKKLVDAAGVETLANSAMTFFDSWSEQKTELARRNTVLHEIAHNLQNLIINEQNWTNLSPWPADRKSTYSGTHEEAFVTRYSKDSPAEDFAESITAYRYAPLWLMERNPEKYEYLREVIFDGIEYLSEETCKKGSSTILKNHEDALVKAFSEYQLKLIDGTIPSIADEAMLKEKNRCDSEFVKNLSTTKHDQCLSVVYAKRFAQEYKSEFIKFTEDTHNVRSADGTGGIPSPKMNDYLKKEIGNDSRNSIRKAFIQDFNTFKTEKGTEAPSCDQFAIKFTNWLTDSDAKASAVTRAGIHDSSMPHSTVRFLRSICEKGVATRPNYVEIFETFKGPGPLTATEFRHGIQETIP